MSILSQSIIIIRRTISQYIERKYFPNNFKKLSPRKKIKLRLGTIPAMSCHDFKNFLSNGLIVSLLLEEMENVYE